jgi:CHASE1-domain containing sensor protein
MAIVILLVSVIIIYYVVRNNKRKKQDALAKAALADPALLPRATIVTRR